MHESVEVPDPVMVVGLSVHDVLLVVRVATPAKPFSAVSVIVEVPAALTLTVTLDGAAAIVKSWTTNVTVVE